MKKIIAISFLFGVATVIAAIAIGIKIEEHNYSERNWQFDNSFARGDLRKTIQEVETYKNVFKRYPVNLRSMRGGIDFQDSAIGDCPPGEPTDYFYKTDRNGTYFEVLSKGKDCRPYTADDIYPTLAAVEAISIGYKGKTDPSSEEILRPANLQSCKEGT